jgi:hypothetical protein
VQPGYAINKKYILIIMNTNGNGMMILILLCVCCCSLSSSAAGGYWTGYIPGTDLYKFRLVNDVLVDHEHKKSCDREKIISEFDKIGLEKKPLSDFLKDHYIIEKTNKNIKKIIKRCGFSGI